MFIYAPKETCSAMYIEHNSLSQILVLLPLIIICSHLNPFRLEVALWPSPLPPSFPSDFSYAMRTQLLLYRFRAFFEIFFGYGDFVYFYPVRVGDPLGGKALDVFYSIVRGIY